MEKLDSGHLSVEDVEDLMNIKVIDIDTNCFLGVCLCLKACSEGLQQRVRTSSEASGATACASWALGLSKSFDRKPIETCKKPTDGHFSQVSRVCLLATCIS